MGGSRRAATPPAHGLTGVRQAVPDLLLLSIADRYQADRNVCPTGLSQWMPRLEFARLAEPWHPDRVEHQLRRWDQSQPTCAVKIEGHLRQAEPALRLLSIADRYQADRNVCPTCLSQWMPRLEFTRFAEPGHPADGRTGVLQAVPGLLLLGPVPAYLRSGDRRSFAAGGACPTSAEHCRSLPGRQECLPHLSHDMDSFL
ncbi:hypothetical protein Mal4_17650 [Maioricimonas rarisocia]|uniref:Uncharacterized protein n=1 Tax=Maioricimonas rarisocia TaxID=2528026 RepID=A0A517Z4N3_9PLAN|nr:hypothetical protein Mal4_17650 [Maioricimonas rarisocia]